MVSLLLIISFLLHIVLIMAVYNLHQQLQMTKRDREAELETLIANFLEEIKQENKLLQNQLANRNDRTKTESAYPVTLEKKVAVMNELKRENKEKNVQPLHVEKQDKLETSIEGQVFQLYRRGQSIEEIAKELNRGKTEVELILKIQKNDVLNT